MIILFSMNALCFAEGESDHIIINAGEIGKMKVRTVFDVLNQVPGVKADDKTVYIRGSDKVIVLLDGYPIKDASGIKWNKVSINSVEKIEVYKGGGSVEYGEDSSGGVVLITSKKTRRFGGNLETYWGNLETQSYNADCQTSVDTLNAGASVGYESTDGFRPNDDREKTRAGIRLDYEVTENLSLGPSMDYYRSKEGRAGFSGAESPNYRADYENWAATLLSNIKGVKSSSRFSEITDENVNPDKPIDAGINVEEFEQEFTYKHSLGKRGSGSLGAGGEYAELDAYTKKTEEGVDLDEKKDQSEKKYWLYATHQVKFDRIPVEMYFGLRGSYYSEFKNAVNPEIRIGYNKEKWGSQIGFNMTDNTPDLKQRYNETTATLPNPDLKKEEAQNYDMSFYVNPTEAVSLNMSVFYNEITDRITITLGSDNVRRYQNVGNATYTGGEASIDWKPVKAVTFNSSYTYIEAKDEDTGCWLPSIPRHKVLFDINVVPLDDFSIAITTEYLSRQYLSADNSLSVPRYTKTDIRAEYKHEKFSIFGKVNNLFDEEYHYGFGYPAPPRTWITGLGYEF